MKIPTSIVGTEAGPVTLEIDARWLMAYAAGIGDGGATYLDTSRRAGIVAHPLFPVCYEWPAAVAIRDRTLSPEVRPRAVHATHDLTIHRLPVPGDRVSTKARVVGVERRKPGAYVVTRFETRAGGAAITTTDSGALYLGVETEGPDRWLIEHEGPPAAPDAPPGWKVEVPVPPGAAHIYTECSRIFNPIHTDRAAARALGLPDIILHGTATLAMAVSALLRAEAGADPTRVQRIRGRFGAMVLMPSTLTVQGRHRTVGLEGGMVPFRVLTDKGEPAISQGMVIL